MGDEHTINSSVSLWGKEMGMAGWRLCVQKHYVVGGSATVGEYYCLQALLVRPPASSWHCVKWVLTR